MKSRSLSLNCEILCKPRLSSSLAFRWVFIPWLQAELDAYRECINFTTKRAD
ncbi:hypothetical protein C8J56DRAFT_787633 [Mycena floridula]|nr:hypothetical protein C8J56DRAFT_787633 [Mycena floridula]